MNLHERLEKIKNREDFIAFVVEMQKDFKENQKDWENWTIDSYLEATVRCLEDNNWNPEGTDWKFLAKVFLGGKHYE